ncbi:hypothetical protein GCM10012275_56760 [Longimycelium tulufanense]|uniref:Uncharacterized protein n=1 Tax=Longimycelium tulufanense TaxID=907463 RepID=A0A8J3CJZ6_9PSEU|nr:hypothetical protein GCM10012275_56760 [Longimycelium tulufanense]
MNLVTEGNELARSGNDGNAPAVALGKHNPGPHPPEPSERTPTWPTAYCVAAGSEP